MASLNTLLFQLLAEAQHQFGPRDPSYQIAVETVSDDQTAPQTFLVGPRQILIRVHSESKTNEACALREIGHEVIHCLAPDLDFTTVLEEGTAAMFALDCAASRGHLRFSPKPPDPYWRPEWLVRQLLQQNDNAIKAIRSIEPNLSLVTVDLIQQVCPRFRFAKELTEGVLKFTGSP